MSIRWYIMPLDDAPQPNASGVYNLSPRYFHDPVNNPGGLPIVSFSGVIEREKKLWCGWAEVTSAQHATISADAMVFSVPGNIDDEIMDDGVVKYLDLIKIPARWIGMPMTYRQVMRGIIEFFCACQSLRSNHAGKVVRRVTRMDPLLRDAMSRVATRKLNLGGKIL